MPNNHLKNLKIIKSVLEKMTKRDIIAKYLRNISDKRAEEAARHAEKYGTWQIGTI